ncbi:MULTISPECIES: hypothetical protein [Exiguobacterium]|uniref:hypothetical protein n=1 Tax=Exiguobacterium TaxID=33986 RepID=UPI001BECE79F|nr:MULTISPECIES: hypothetical protein [Exiguobacterium]MCT4784600.1 hypothetical protein [Exiguobacterium himgiriensis]
MRTLLMMAATFLLIIMLSVEGTALAAFNRLFQFQDRGIEQVAMTSEENVRAASVTDQNVTVTLEQMIAGQHKLALRFAVEGEKIQLGDETAFHLEYRIQAKDGTYLDEFISDTKPLKGEGDLIGHRFNTYIDSEEGVTIHEILAESKNRVIPSLDGAKVHIETLHWTRDGRSETVNGDWTLPLQTTLPGDVIQYEMSRSEGGIEVIRVATDMTSTHVVLRVDGERYDENFFVDNVYLNDGNGTTYRIETGYRTEVTEGKTTLTFHLPYTTMDATHEIDLGIKGIGEVKMTGPVK